LSSNQKKHFYNVAVSSKLPKILTYHSFEKLKIGTIVDIKVLNSKRKGIIISENNIIPEFETKEIEGVDFKYFFDNFQLESAKFISTYYFSSISEALNLFLPQKVEKNRSIQREKVELTSPLPLLSNAQQRAFDKLSKEKIALLFGVTGSGKSEIYITKIAQTINEGKNAILIMPEIALTPQMEARLKKYFGDMVAIWHSKLSKKAKDKTLEKIYSGEIKVVAGARSALFVPLKNIGLFIVDEEHDDSYKSQSRPRYHARDLAIYFATKLGATIWLGSATPSLTSYIKYPVIRLKESFIKTQKNYKFIQGDGVTSTIIKYLKANLKAKKESLVFVPTRANFKYLYCPSCGTTQQCPFCSVGMSLNRQKRYLRCHYCNYTQTIPDRCKECGHSPLSNFRIGTQEVIELIKEEIPQIRIEQFDKDSITTLTKLKKALERISKKEVDLIVGTQMLSKGHDYADITLSVIMGLDYILGLPDYRAKERAVSLLHQIAGRSGRFQDSTILIQTKQKELFLPYIDDYEEFLKDEKEFVEGLYPPSVRLARILIAHKKDTKAKSILESLIKSIKQFDEIEIVGYGKAPVEKIANRYRYTVLLRAKKATALLNALYRLDLSEVEVDMDPVDFS
jgi:primosomal protein N' (replication factor Y)